MDKTDIEEGIKICKSFIEENKDRPIILHKSIENILADRESKIEDIQRLQETLDKSDANNVELQQEIETLKNDTYWKGYIDKQNETAEICKICTYKTKANKYDALEKQVKKYKNMYEAEHRIHLVRNEQLERKEIAVQKANKYDALVDTIKRKIESTNIQAKQHKDETILTIIEREKLILQDLLKIVEGEYK